MRNFESESKRRWQISLRSWIVATLMAGIVAGLTGPRLVRWVRRWFTPTTISLPATEYEPIEPETAGSETTGYFESAESPLR